MQGSGNFRPTIIAALGPVYGFRLPVRDMPGARTLAPITVIQSNHPASIFRENPVIPINFCSDQKLRGTGGAGLRHRFLL